MGVWSQSWRSWNRSKGVALLAVLAFAIGIGSATAIFTVISGVMLRLLPYPDGDRFVALYGANPREPGRMASLSISDLQAYQQQTTSFDVFGWFRMNDFNLTFSGDTQFVPGAAVTPSLAQNLGVVPVLGRWFTDGTEVVVSSRLWRRLGADPDIVGRPLTLDNRRLTVTGVMPPSFRLPTAGSTPGSTGPEVWVSLDPTGASEPPGQAYFAYGRRKAGLTLAQADADVKRVAADIARREPLSHPSYTATVVDLQTHSFSNLRTVLLMLLAGAGLLLLIACANVATLLLARSVARARETAIRITFGAPRRHLALRYLTEALVVSVLGAVAGIALSALLVRLILVAGSEYVPNADDIVIDWKVVGFSAAVTFLASAIASLAPLWHAVRAEPNAVLSDGARASSGIPARRVSRGLVVAEIALAFTLFAISAVLVGHLRSLTRVPTGLNPDNLLTFALTVPDAQATARALGPYQRRLLDALGTVPAVMAAALTNQLPLDGCCFGGTIYPEGRTPAPDARRVAFLFVTPDFLSAMGIPLRAGRFLTEADTSEEMLFAVVNKAAVDRYWPDRNPVGAYGRMNRPDGDRFQVVGVVENVRNDGLNAAPEAELYLLATLIPVNPMTIVVRSALPPQQLVPAIRRAVQTVDRSVAIHDLRMMSDIVNDSLQLERVSSIVMTFFAAAALVMATLGIYGVVSYAVRQRTVELGTRMAIGALGKDVVALVVGGGLTMAGMGVVVGSVSLAAGIWLVVRFLDVREVSWMPVASSAGVVGLVAVAASYVPAWRATLLSPMVAMRDEPASGWQVARARIATVVREVRQAVSTTPVASWSPLLNDFAAATRSADSFDGALRRALAMVSERLDTDSAAILERGPHGSYRRRTTLGLFEALGLEVPADGFLVKRLTAWPMPLPFEADEFTTLAEWAAANRPERLEEIRGLAAATVRMAVPLQTRHELIGLLLLGPRRGQESYGESERQLLRHCADQFALMMENARLTARVVEQETLRRDLALAAEVQKQLLPDSPPAAEIAEFAAISLPARSIGGDYYDFVQVGDRRIGVALADVSGKGVAAALIMSVVQASLRLIASEGNISLPRLAAKMNDFLYRTTPGNKYATFFYAQLDGATGQLQYVNAGHNPPYLLRTARPDEQVPPDGRELLELTAGGAVVGMLPGLTYEEATVQLYTGDVLLAFTDGVTEAHNPANEEFGEERLKGLVRSVGHLPAEEIRSRISAELKNWIEDAEQYDDLTFVVMKVK